MKNQIRVLLLHEAANQAGEVEGWIEAVGGK